MYNRHRLHYLQKFDPIFLPHPVRGTDGRKRMIGYIISKVGNNHGGKTIQLTVSRAELGSQWKIVGGRS